MAQVLSLSRCERCTAPCLVCAPVKCRMVQPCSIRMVLPPAAQPCWVLTTPGLTTLCAVRMQIHQSLYCNMNTNWQQCSLCKHVYRYIKSLYWSMTTFTTVGYGDYSPQNIEEQMFVIMYELLNVGLLAYVTATFTLFVTKADAKTGQWRDTLYNLRTFIRLHGIGETGRDRSLSGDMQKHLQLHFQHEEVRPCSGCGYLLVEGCRDTHT